MPIVHSYRAYWNLKQHVGTILVVTADEEVHEYSIKVPAEFSAIVDLLRNEDPINLDIKDHILGTFAEGTGEGE